MHCDLQSVEAFEAARKGAVRPSVPDAPIVYDIVIKYFKPPYVGLQVQCTGASVKFLTSFVQEIGFMVDSTASVRRLHCSRIGPFLAKNALLGRDFNLRSVIKNIVRNREVIEGYGTGSNVASAEEHTPTEEEQDLEEVEERGATECVRMAWPREYTSA
uniref:TruB_N domain-containing protein n=1 Tax=Steinernema glaseri TaxID=37863 RepID=A0A1I7YLA4_9BILA